MKVPRFVRYFAVAQLTIFIALTAGTALAGGHPKASDCDDVVDVAVGAGDFNTLAAALEAAGLVESLKSDGPFTVFAPTDAAFEKLPEGTLDALLNPENRDRLVAILTYHVVPGKVPASRVVDLNSATTLNGADVRIDVADGAVKVNDANVIKTDIKASNGIIHVIDSVILPN